MVEHLPSTSKVLGSIPITEGREGDGEKGRAGAGERRESGEGEKEKRRKRAIEMVISHLPACSPVSTPAGDSKRAEAGDGVGR